MEKYVSSSFLKNSKVKIEIVGVFIEASGLFCSQISNLSNSLISRLWVEKQPDIAWTVTHHLHF